MLSTVARRSALTAVQRRLASTAAHPPPSTMHTPINAGLHNMHSSRPALGFYTARLGRTLTLVVPGAALLAWPFATRALGYSTSWA